MKIAITTVQAPFITGGAEFLANNLKDALIRRGHQAEIISIPFMDSPCELIEDHIVASRLFDLSYSWAGKIDLCIGLKFPAYYIPHPNKVIWALHQHRAAYDLFDTEYSNLKNDTEGRRYRDIITNADNLYLKEAKRIYTIAANVSRRMEKYNNLQSIPLYHPCPDMDKFYCDECEDYILMPSRINITKRQLLAIEAMTLSKTNTKLYIMGKADAEYEKNRMLSFIKECKLQNKIKYFDYVSQEDKFKLYAKAKAILFIPLDEDYGYITLEAMAASKPIITAKDSGGPLEFVVDNRNGMIVESTPTEIAKAFDYIASSTSMYIEMGKQSKLHLQEMNITWDKVVKELIK
ncbi:glycosyltransferase [Lachnospiraceae bacterium MD1]|uniref:Glycosyltransferase n=1 Tax=Variimorphobacter saccharofermentans TaxID=2755051 RepID=A0A839K2C2_9FIRM|nr:glycosyltransferase [Variimorphobacter saccharofermentans]MBB2182841.1 glycosyltransferase [Variimorphobacter saccharofermentans]